MVRTRRAVRRRSRVLSRLSWATLTIMPWCLAAGLLVSATAEAGQDPASAAPGAAMALAARADLYRAAWPRFRDSLPMRLAALLHEDAAADEAGARGGRADAGEAPLPAGFADPEVGGRPIVEAGLRVAGSLDGPSAAGLAFGPVDAASAGFTAMPVDAPWADPSRFVPWRPEAPPPVVLASLAPPAPPPPSEAVPLEMAGGAKTPRDARPDYAGAIQTSTSAAEQLCLAQAVYFEARSEPEEGQAAVAQVVLNRAKSGIYPGSVCGVVFQDHWRRNACQFSFACEGHPLRVLDAESWGRAVRIAREVTQGATYLADVGEATHYHADYVRPYWASSFKRMDAIGHHIFYAMRQGQS